MLKLRRAIVLDAGPVGGLPAAAADDGTGEAGEDGEQRLAIDLAGEAGAPRTAIADVALVGRSRVGDELIVNVEALDLGLGSGGFDVVHANLTRGVADAGAGTGADGAGTGADLGLARAAR